MPREMAEQEMAGETTGRGPATVVVIGLSHTTWKPASSAAFAMAKCELFGVTIVTKSMRRSSGSARSRSISSSHEP